ncbi:MAG TPA: retropepsin-like aspartic protease [Candidatus Didemnitutus sp.]
MNTTQGFVLVPLAREKSGHITVEAQLAGRAARFIVDTGAGGTIVDVSAADAFQLKLRSHHKEGGGVGSGPLEVNLVARHDLRLAGVDLSGTKLLAMDLSHVNARLAKAGVEPVVGVVGADFLWRHRAVIDYDKGQMLFSE